MWNLATSTEATYYYYYYHYYETTKQKDYSIHILKHSIGLLVINTKSYL